MMIFISANEPNDRRTMRNPMLVLILSFLSIFAYGQTNFIRVPLAKGASIEVPINWVVISQNNRTNIDAYVEANGYKLTESNLPFAANLYDDNGKTVALVNSRFYPENPFTQQMVSTLKKEDIAVIDKELRSATEKLLPSMGGKLVKWKSTQLIKTNGLFVLKHGHIAVIPPSADTIHEYRYRVLASPRSFTVTISYKQSYASLIEPIANKMASSIMLE